MYRAAQHGLEAKLLWPDLSQSGYREQSLGNIIERVLPIALEGLEAIGVSTAESERYLGVIEQRLRHRQTGASWQLSKLQNLQRKMPLAKAQHALLEEYLEHSVANLPVAEWPL